MKEKIVKETLSRFRYETILGQSDTISGNYFSILDNIGHISLYWGLAWGKIFQDLGLAVKNMGKK